MSLSCSSVIPKWWNASSSLTINLSIGTDQQGLRGMVHLFHSRVAWILIQTSKQPELCKREGGIHTQSVYLQRSESLARVLKSRSLPTYDKTRKEKVWGLEGLFTHPLMWDNYTFITPLNIMEFDDFSKFSAYPAPDISLSRRLINRLSRNVWPCRDWKHYTCRINPQREPRVSKVCGQECYYNADINSVQIALLFFVNEIIRFIQTLFRAEAVTAEIDEIMEHFQISCFEDQNGLEQTTEEAVGKFGLDGIKKHFPMILESCIIF